MSRESGQQWAVKARPAGEKRHLFVTSRLTMNRRRIHAGRFSALPKAVQAADERLSESEQVDAAVVLDAATSRIMHRSATPAAPATPATPAAPTAADSL